MGDWNLIEMLRKIAAGSTGAGVGGIPSELAGGSGGQGYVPSAQGAQMEVPTPGELGPMGGPIQTADTIGHGVPRASLGRGEDFMRLLKRGLGGQAPSLPEAGARQQMFADFPRPGYDPTQRRY
jgi:hypothetical protein